jgi:hypothetical protein
MRAFTMSAAVDVASGKNVLIAKLSGNFPLLKEVLLRLQAANVTKTPSQKEFLANLCNWCIFNTSFTPKQLPAAIQFCFSHKEKVDEIIAYLESDDEDAIEPN